MSSKMAAPYRTLLKFLNYGYFAKLGSPKNGSLTNMTELYPFLKSKKAASAI